MAKMKIHNDARTHVTLSLASLFPTSTTLHSSSLVIRVIIIFIFGLTTDTVIDRDDSILLNSADNQSSLHAHSHNSSINALE
jgi:hypothetical protein